MQIFYLMLVFKEGVLLTAAADKNDDSKITHKALSDIIDEFVKQYGGIINEWSGDVRMFKDFEKTIDQVLKNGKIAEIPLKIPILKIYKKDFLKSREKLTKKGLVLSEDDLRKVTDKKPEWTSKKLPWQVINQGFLNQNEYNIAHLADGFHTLAEISEEAGIPAIDAQKIIDNLDKLGLLDFVDVK